MRSRSRGALFFAPRALSKPFPKTLPNNDTVSRPSSEPFGVDRPNGSRSPRCTNERTERKKRTRKQNADRRVSNCCTCRRSAHPAGRARLSAFHCGSRQGDSWSPRLGVRPCFPGRSGAFDPVRPPQPGGGDLARLRGRYPRRNNKRPSQCSEHLARRSLCRQDDARAARVQRGRTPCPRAPHPAPPAVRLRPASLQESEMHSFSSPRGANSRNSGGASHPVDGTRIFFLFV